jgi:propanol-preferring alcohol dehydrogenase
MKAALLDATGFSIQDVERPVAGEGHALVHLTAAGVCHSDVHLVRHDWAGATAAGPFGHEGVGIVEALGPGADRFVQVGDRVILGLGGSGGGHWCGACSFCLDGRPRLCAQAKGIAGTYAEYLSVNARSLVVLPDQVGDHEVPLACGGLTAYGAVRKLQQHGVAPGAPIAIVGAAGGLGHYAVQLAGTFGYKVVGVDKGDNRVGFLATMDLHTAVDADEAEEVVEGSFGGVAACIVFSPRIAGFQLGLRLLRRGGVFISVGIPATSEGNLEISPLELFRRDLVIASSAVGNVQEMRELVELAADGRVATHVSRVGTLSQLGQILDELEAGAYLGRAVLDDLAN